MLIRPARFFVQLNVPGVLDVSINREPRAKYSKQTRTKSIYIDRDRANENSISSCFGNPNWKAAFNDPAHKGSNFKVKLKIVPIINRKGKRRRRTCKNSDKLFFLSPFFPFIYFFFFIIIKPNTNNISPLN